MGINHFSVESSTQCFYATLMNFSWQYLWQIGLSFRIWLFLAWISSLEQLVISSMGMPLNCLILRREELNGLIMYKIDLQTTSVVQLVWMAGSTQLIYSRQYACRYASLQFPYRRSYIIFFAVLMQRLLSILESTITSQDIQSLMLKSGILTKGIRCLILSGQIYSYFIDRYMQTSIKYPSSTVYSYGFEAASVYFRYSQMARKRV